jgi:hypothetical protein
MVAPAPLSDRFATSDAVLVVDVLEIREPRLNSVDMNWWSPPHSEDPTLVRPRVGMDVRVTIVGVLKLRSGATTFALRPGSPDLSNVGSPHPSATVPNQPAVGDMTGIWVQGGIAVVNVTSEEWQKYLSDWGGGADDDIHEGTPQADQPIPAQFTMEVGGQPGMDLGEGGRYIVFLRAFEVPQREGPVRHVWTADYSMPRTQLLVDPATTTFIEPVTETVSTVTDLLDALLVARDSDLEPESYRIEEFDRLFATDL